ncbi:Yos1p [Ascoidea rubescens DSM 1968]|uniref:Yos1-like protein n=1 Tax=Ascoidea rubescens DSM 1968 TaxID=1344418 RepID=A0A1D2VS00_9ASCO|nr:Yos1-like protein [Ascoidea rubescens DSM 1968]ODV64347.1 Yos1-like protein [Ascoidea rubescens DSM 1968]
MFGLGGLLYVIVLFINSICVLSEDRFLNRIGWGNKIDQQAFGGPLEATIKSRLISLISAIRTLLKCM